MKWKIMGIIEEKVVGRGGVKASEFCIIHISIYTPGDLVDI